MKLLFDCTDLSFFYDNNGHRAGIFNVALNIYNELKKQNIDLTFVCDYKRYYFMKEIKEFTDIKLLEEHNLINKIIGKLIYLTRNYPIRLRYAILILARFYDAFFYKKNTKNKKQLEGFDAYFSPFTPPCREIQDANIKKFRMVHDTIPIIENGYPKSPKDWYYKIYNSLNTNDFYITNSQNTKNDLLKYFPNIPDSNVKVTYLGASNNFVPQINNKKDKYIFSLCTLGKRKNIIFLVKNFYKFIEKYQINDLKLVLGGGTWEKFKKTLNNNINNFDQDKIILTGYIQDEQLPHWYSNALFFVYPSLYEGFGLPVLEAMKCGCPVITSNVSSLPEVIGNAGIKINPTNDEELIEAMYKMYSNEFYRKLCTERGLIQANKFSWEKCTLELLEFIKTKIV